MNNQEDTTRIYTTKDEETSPDLKRCPQCGVHAVPRGLTSTAKTGNARSHCPNCGQVYGVNSLLTRVLRSIVVSGAGDAIAIHPTTGTLQLSVAVLPDDALDHGVVWSIINGTGSATISAGGLVTGVSDGFVTAIATAHDNSGIIGQIVLTISTLVTGITVSGAGAATTITVDNGTLQMAAAITPAEATDQAVVWSVAPGTGTATISATGLLTALTNGTVTVTATAHDGSGITDDEVITLSNQV